MNCVSVSQSPFNIDDMQVDETTIMTIQDGKLSMKYKN